MGAYTSTRREEDKPDSYTWRGRKGGRDGSTERKREREGWREYQSLPTSRACDFLYLKLDAL